MNERAQFSVGQTLRDAREDQGISLEDAAARLRLMHRQVEAMETDDFEALGQPVFARGFVRNYARMLGLESEPLLAQMGGALAEPPPVSHAEPPLPRSWLTSPWLILLLLGALVMVAAPVGLYLWLNSEVDEGSAAPHAAGSAPRAAASRPAVAVKPAPVAAPRPGAEAVPVDAPAEGAPPAVPATSPQATPESRAPEAVEAAAAAASEAPARGMLHLEFGEEAWTDIKDAEGRTLHRQLNAAGSSADIEGQPPFRVIIGNAVQARLTYNGRPIDLKPFIDVTVARFTLEQ